MQVLRICSVFDPPRDWTLDRVDVDPVGGMQFHTGQLTRELDRRGVSQTIVTAHLPGVPRRHRATPRLVVHRLGVDVPWCRQLYGPPATVVASRAARGADLVHVHLGEDLAVLPVARAAAMAGRCPMVLTVHCSLRHTLVGRDPRSVLLRHIGGMLERSAERRVAAVITLTNRLATRLADTGVPRERLHVLPSGFDPDLFAAPADDPLLALASPRVVFVGRLARQKGIDTLLDAADRVGAPVHFVLVGDGPERRRIEERTTNCPVTIMGFLPHDRIPAILRSADIVVLPSLYEELGSVLVEASAVGAAIVATDTGGVPEVIDDGVTGVLVPSGSPERLAAAIDDLLADPARRHRLGQAARRSVAHLEWPALARQTHAIYDAVLDSPRAATP